MRKLLLFGMIWLPFWAQGQVDTVVVVREVDSLIQVSRVLSGKGEFDKALEINSAAEKIAIENLGRASAVYGSTCFNHGRVQHIKGDFIEAEKWYLESKAIQRKALGKEHPDYAKSLNNLAALYRVMGIYEKAEPHSLEAKAIREKALGKEHPDYAMSLHNLATLYHTMGNYEKVEPLYLETQAIWEKILGKEHPDYAMSLHNLATLYKDMGNYKKAESLNLEAKAIREKALGKEHTDYAMSLNNLAALYRIMGNYEKAEPLYLEAKSIREKALGKGHPDYALSLSNLATLYWQMGNYEKAEPLFLEAQAIWEKALGKEHPDYALSPYSLASLYVETGNYEKAKPLFDELAYLIQSQLTKAQYYLSERELNSYMGKFSESQAQMLSFNQASANHQFNITQTCYDNTLFYKGFLLNAANQVKRLALSDSTTIEKNNLLKSYGRRLAAQYSKPIAERKGVDELEEKSNTLEKELVRTVAGFGEAQRQVTWQEVMTVLKPGEAAIEFVSYRYHDPEPTDSTMYAALVLRHSDSELGFFPLFEEREIAPLLAGASGARRAGINLLYTAQPSENGQKGLYDLIWKPLEAQLEGVKTVYCSPAGLLHRLNLGAIATGAGKTFSDEHELVVLGSTRRLVVQERAVPQTNVARVIGGVQYDNDSTAIADAIRLDAETRGMEPSNEIGFHPADSLRGDTWNYLPESETEALELRQILKKTGHIVQLDTGYMATEESIKRLGTEGMSPYILHIATHGFFFPDPKNRNEGRGMRDGEQVFKMSEHPMMRSGLMLAGAQEAWATGKAPEGREDGILTAYEISQLNLSNTELVVLSACETGLGDIEGNEGVYGLQRAFKIAGAKYLIMSLWKVSDKSTRELMSEFYRQWLEMGLKIPAAFRTAQANMKAKYADSPYLWAGFVLVE